MKYREQVKMLKDAGFWYEREGTRHELWTNGAERIAISKGCSHVAPTTLKSFISRLRKAKRAMEEAQAMSVPEVKCG